MTRPALLLDLDSTLTDSRPAISASIHAALRDLGHAPDPAEDLTWVIGPPMEQVMGRVLQRFGACHYRSSAEVTSDHPVRVVQPGTIIPSLDLNDR